MIITSIEKTKNNMNMIFIDNKYYFTLADEDVFKHHIYEGNKISKEDINYIYEHVLFSKAKCIAIRFISYKMRTSSEVEKKLIDNKFTKEITDKTIKFLQEYGYVDDRTYTGKYIKDCEKLKRWSYLRIRYELIERGIDPKIIDELLIENNHKEIQKALYFLNKKKSNLHDENGKLKLKSYLSNKGFGYNIINEAIKVLLKER